MKVDIKQLKIYDKYLLKQIFILQERNENQNDYLSPEDFASLCAYHNAHNVLLQVFDVDDEDFVFEIRDELIDDNGKLKNSSNLTKI